MQKIYLLFLFLSFFTMNLYAEYVATITALQGEVLILRDATSLQAKTGSQLLKKDSIKTAKNAKVQIIFEDETIISIGKNSTFSIQDYYFDATEASKARFGMIGGAMRAITGKIGKIAPQKFSVSTKTATIGIRGTNFTVVVNDNGSLQAYCTYGEITVKVNGHPYSVSQGFFISIDKNNNVLQKEFSPKMLKKMKKQYFGTIKHKNSTLSKEFDSLQKSGVDEKQLDITINNGTSVIIEDSSEDAQEVVQQAKTLDATIQSYKMENATYFGSYTTEMNQGSLPSTGDVKLSINFAQESATLKIGDFQDPNPIAIYRFEDVNKNEIYGLQEGEIGTATATFYGNSGNIVDGSFQYSEEKSVTAIGKYSTKTYETLH